MDETPSHLESKQSTRRDAIIGLSIMTGLPAIAGLGALGASGPDLAHASPMLVGIGALLIGVGMTMFRALVRSLV